MSSQATGSTETTSRLDHYTRHKLNFSNVCESTCMDLPAHRGSEHGAYPSLEDDCTTHPCLETDLEVLSQCDRYVTFQSLCPFDILTTLLPLPSTLMENRGTISLSVAHLKVKSEVTATGATIETGEGSKYETCGVETAIL